MEGVDYFLIYSWVALFVGGIVAYVNLVTQDVLVALFIHLTTWRILVWTQSDIWLFVWGSAQLLGGVGVAHSMYGVSLTNATMIADVLALILVPILYFNKNIGLFTRVDWDAATKLRRK